MSKNKNERYEKWYEEAKKQTLETLPAFMKKILDEPQDYNSKVAVSCGVLFSIGCTYRIVAV